jgi:hypothetical protein
MHRRSMTLVLTVNDAQITTYLAHSYIKFKPWYSSHSSLSNHGKSKRNGHSREMSKSNVASEFVMMAISYSEYEYR